MTKAADEFLQRCADSDQIPDVFEFLASRDGLSERAQVDVLLVDQFQRWKLNQIIPVDQYLDRTPDIGDIYKVELLIEEFGYLDQRGIAPAAEDFVKRYLALSADARLELCEALELEGVSDTDSGSDPPSNDGGSSKSTPELIGRYEVVRLLGKGAFGKVFLAKDPDLDRSVAIKVPTNKRVKMGGGVEEFLDEARAVAKLDHPNIVPVYDVGITEDKRCFVVSKYVRGKELRAEIRKGISHRESAWIIGSLARALHAAHVAGIVHRDVKPGNVIIDSKRQPHLLDFGLAYREQEDFDGDAVVGTPAYMSPEQAEGGSHRVDGRSDIYSLAVIFYEMLTGHRPSKSEKLENILAHLKLGEIRPPRQSDDTIPVELEQICLKALSRKLSERYNTAKDMADEIEAWLIETSTGDDSFPLMGMISGSSDSLGSSPSSKKLLSSKAETLSLVSFLKSPATIVIGAIAVGLGAIIAFTNPPWEVSGVNDSPSELAVGENDSSLISASEAAAKFPQRIAVLGFRNLAADSDAWLATALSELLTEELEKSEQLSLVTSENVSLMKTDLDLSESDSLGSSALTRIKTRVSADWVVLGSLEAEADDSETIRFSVTAQNTSGDPSEILFTNTIRREQWLDLIAQSASHLRRELNLKAPDVAATGQLFPSTPKLEASKDYFEGVALLRSFDPLAAITKFTSAAAVDSKSALIQDGLARSFESIGNRKLAREHSEKAVETCRSLPLNQRLVIKGRHCLLSGRPTEAVTHFRSLLEIRNESVESLLLLASALTTAGQGREALMLMEEARSKPLFGAANARVELAAAKAAQSVSKFAEQVEFSKAAIESSKAVGARSLEGQASLLRGIGLKRLSKHEESLVCFDHAFKSFDKLGDKKNAAVTIASWAKALTDNGQLDLAEAKIKEGMELSKSLDNQQLNAKYKSLLGEVAVFRGKFDDAAKLLQEALAAYTELGDWQGVASMNLILANVFARTAKLDEAMKMVAGARKAFQATGNRLAEGRTWGQEGAMRARTGDTMEGQRCFTRALELFREVSDQRSVAICLGDLASTHSNQGHLTQAGELYSEALELHRQIGSKRGPEMVMFNLSNLYARTGRLEDALQLMTESFERFEKLNVGLHAVFAQRKLAEVQMRCGDLTSAKQTLAATMARTKEAENLAVEAQAIYTQHHFAIYEGEPQQAIEHLKASQKISGELKQEIRVALCDFGMAYIALQQNDAKTAEKLLSGAETKIVSLQPELKPTMLFVRARAQAMNGKLPDAEATFLKADTSTQEHQTEDLSIQLARRHERAMALKAMDRDDEAAKEIATVTKLADKYGWLALKWEATLQSYEWKHAAKENVPADRIAALQETVSERGFVAFANRLDAIQARSASE